MATNLMPALSPPWEKASTGWWKEAMLMATIYTK